MWTAVVFRSQFCGTDYFLDSTISETMLVLNFLQERQIVFQQLGASRVVCDYLGQMGETWRITLDAYQPVFG